MTVTIICDVLGKENNGTTIAAMNLIRSLKAKGHTVRVVCSDRDKEMLPGYYILPTYSFGPLNSYVAKNGVALTKPDIMTIRKALHGADVVHMMIPFAASSAAVKIAREYGIPITAGFHCQAENFTNHIFMMNNRLANKITYKIFYDNLYRYCTCVHYPTRFICDVFEKQVGPTNHYIISNGVSKDFVRRDVPKPAELENKFVILFTGRYSREKSHTVLIDGVAKSKYKDLIQLIFAGAGPQKENIIEHAKKQNIHMPIMKFYSREELLKVINYADLYVHPAEIEIEAISCLEAISCGKVPVISNSIRSATRYFALTENNRFHCNDSNDLAAKIDYWIEHPHEKELCSQQYLGYAQQFDFDRCMDRMEQMLQDAIRLGPKKMSSDKRFSLPLQKLRHPYRPKQFKAPSHPDTETAAQPQESSEKQPANCSK